MSSKGGKNAPVEVHDSSESFVKFILNFSIYSTLYVKRHLIM